MAALALGGPIACVTAATVGVTALAMARAITPANYPCSWMTWYVGDTIGVVIFTPILANKEGGGGARATVVVRSVRPKGKGNGDG